MNPMMPRLERIGCKLVIHQLHAFHFLLVHWNSRDMCIVNVLFSESEEIPRTTPSTSTIVWQTLHVCVPLFVLNRLVPKPQD